MSQTALADAIGITFQQVQKYEKGANRVGSGRLVRIADALDVPVMTLLPASGRRRECADASPLALIAERSRCGSCRRSRRSTTDACAAR